MVLNLLQNEQSMSLVFCNLAQKDAKGVFQTFANRTLRQFRKLNMYIHAGRCYREWKFAAKRYY